VLIIDNWTNHSWTNDFGSIALVGGQKYDLKMEYYENGGGAVANLNWMSPSQPQQVIPQNRLFPPAAPIQVPQSDPGLLVTTGAAGGAGITIGGLGDYATIQEAIDAAHPGETVTLGALRFYVPAGLVLRPGVSLRGVSPLATILDGQGAPAVLSLAGVPADGLVIVEQLAVTGGGSGIDTGSSRALLRNLLIAQNAGAGVLAGQAGSVEGVCLTVADNGGSGISVFTPVASFRNLIVSGNRGSAVDGTPSITFSTLAGGIAFRDPSALDYREQPGAASIDQGDPADPFDLEPLPNGGRVNQGAFGNTPDATSAPLLLKVSPETAGVEGGSGSRCGATGAEALLVLALLALRRRSSPAE